jgi:hypothetical protein
MIADPLSFGYSPGTFRDSSLPKECRESYESKLVACVIAQISYFPVVKASHSSAGNGRQRLQRTEVGNSDTATTLQPVNEFYQKECQEKKFCLDRRRDFFSRSSPLKCRFSGEAWPILAKNPFTLIL